MRRRRRLLRHGRGSTRSDCGDTPVRPRRSRGRRGSPRGRREPHAHSRADHAVRLLGDEHLAHGGARSSPRRLGSSSRAHGHEHVRARRGRERVRARRHRREREGCTGDAVRVEAAPLRFDEHGVASLDGTWEFFPGDHELRALDALVPEEIRVPGLWESQGHLELDGIAWYRRNFGLDATDGFWTLRFGAVMDVAEVYVNGESVGAHENPFTPFDLDVTEAVELGANEVAVRVFDPSVDDPEHLRLPHGKQGWANHHFPSRPSLYMTYGGIWQPVQVQRHGPLVVTNVFVNADPGDVRVVVEIGNRATAAVRGRLGIRALGAVWESDVDVASEAVVQVEAALGPTTAARWTPERPELHEALVDVVLDDGAVSHATKTRFGLRTVRVGGRDIVVNDEPYRMKSVLVQGFHADALYAEASREEIEAEVRAAAELGFNTLRLHIKC